ncbi:hypothetical protein Q1695_004911 [Nippostrongylus brasiliensis]|nr:hypothetical protein Q1695_004911 [Nippostrongylus brasiliensis]
MAHCQPTTMERPPMNQEEFDRRFEYELPQKKKSVFTRFTSVSKKYWQPFTSPRNFGRTIVSFLPIIHWLPRYPFKTDLLHDFTGGLTVGIMHIPQGIAYAILAGVDPVVGLYSSLFPVILYIFFGTSQHASTGTFAVVSLMTSKPVYRLTGGAASTTVSTTTMGSLASSTMTGVLSTSEAPATGPTAVEVATALAVLIGIIQVFVGTFGLDFVMTYFSDELVAGFTTGASFHIFVTQVKDVVGIPNLPRRTGIGNCVMKIYDLCANIARTNLITLALSAGTIVMLLLGKHLLNPCLKKRLHCPVPVPMELIAIILGTLISYFAKLNEKYDVEVVGLIPAGLPPPVIPHLELIPKLIVDAISITVVVMAIHVSLAKMLAKKYQYEVDVNQEFYAMGFTSLLSGFFPVIPHSTSLSRTVVSAGAGSRTQVCMIFSCILVLIIVLFAGSILQPLPMCVIGSVILAALLGMFRKFKQLIRLWQLSKIDFSIWLMAFSATVLIDVMEGLAIAILFALFTTIIREQWPRWHILANIAGTYDFRDVERYRHIYFFNGVCVLRFDSPLLFTNVERFRKVIENIAADWDCLRCCGKANKKQLILGEQNEKDTVSVTSENQKKFLIVDCSGFAYVDMMGVNSLKEIHEDLRDRGVSVFFAAAKAPVRELFEASGLYAAVAKTNFYPTIYDAIAFAQAERSGGSPEDTNSEDSYVNHAVDTTDETIDCPETPRIQKS